MLTFFLVVYKPIRQHIETVIFCLKMNIIAYLFTIQNIIMHIFSILLYNMHFY